MNTPDKIKIKLYKGHINIFSAYVDCLLVSSKNFLDVKKLDIFMLNKVLLDKLSINIKKKAIINSTEPTTISIPTEQAIALFIVCKVTNINMGIYNDVVIQKIINQIHKEVIV